MDEFFFLCNTLIEFVKGGDVRGGGNKNTFVNFYSVVRPTLEQFRKTFLIGPFTASFCFNIVVSIQLTAN